MRKPNRAKISVTTCGAERVGSIDDVLTQILVHLPWKPLVSFKTVSKHWDSIISHPSFQFMVAKKHTNCPTGLIFQITYSYRSNFPPPRVETHLVSFSSSSNNNAPPHQTLVLPDALRIFHSCNGLLLLKHTNLARHFYVYNPTTNQKTTTNLLKDVVNARPRDKDAGMYLAFDPTKSPHYKVVCVWELDWQRTNYVTRGQYQFEVYSSETGSWKTRGGYKTKDAGFVHFNKGVYWNGAIHWFSLLGKCICFNPDDDDDEMPTARVMPPVPRHKSRIYFFRESCGHLHYTFYGCDHDLVYVYELRRDYSEWFLKYSSHCLPNIRHLYSVVRGNKDEDNFLVLGNAEGEIIRYDLVHNTCRTIPGKAFDIQWNDSVSCVTNSFQYIESPCSV